MQRHSDDVLLLVLFAFVAGAGTALSPCVLPVLPALLSAGATGGRRRPLGIVLGLAVTFTVTIVGLATVVDGVGLGESLVRDLAIVALAGFGLAVAIPRLQAPLYRLAQFGPRGYGHGFWSGLGVGAALGFLYAPCAGPVLAAVVAVSAASGRTVAVGLAYALGSAAVLFVLALFGRRVDAAGARAGAEPRARRRDGADRGGDGVPARHPLPDRDRRRAAGGGGEPHALAGDLEGGRRAAREAAPAVAVLARGAGDARGLRARARVRRQRPLVQQPSR